MKSVVVILIDALSYENFSSNKYRKTPMPFLTKLAEEGVSCTKMYSMGPYTEAALASCICGENTLDNNGYMKGINDCPETLHEIFNKNGYNTFSTYSPYIFSESYIRGINHYIYNRFYDFKILIEYRLEHFRDKYINKCILDYELNLCVEILKEGIRTWKKQLIDIICNDESTLLIREAVISKDKEINKLYQVLETEYNNLCNDGILYIKNFFEVWEKSTLYNMSDNFIYNINKRFYIEGIEEKYYDIYKIIQNKQNTLLKQNMPISFKYCLNTMFNNSNFRAIPSLIKSYIGRYNSTDIISTINGEKCREKVIISAKRQLDYFAEKIESCVKRNENNYTFIHLEDFHTPGMFYSYDLKDDKLRKDELESGIRFVDSLPDSYRGNLLADLSSHYLDDKIKEFVTRLKSINDISFVFMADHGFAHNYNPPRLYNDTTFYVESYHIPFILYGNKINKNMQIDKIFASKDIIQSILEYTGLSDEKQRDSRVVWKDKERDYALVEYCGPGCPDYITSTLHYAIIDENYIIGCKAKLEQHITSECIDKIFDLKKDEFLESNLKNKIKNSNIIKGYLKKIEQRHLELQGEYTKWMTKKG